MTEIFLAPQNMPKDLEQLNREYMDIISGAAKPVQPPASVVSAPAGPLLHPGEVYPFVPDPQMDAAADERPVKRKKKVNAVAVISDMLFGVLIAIAVLIVVVSQNSKSEAGWLGFKFYIAEETSEYDDYSKDTVMLVRKVDPRVIGAGDNIAFYAGDQKVVTQRVSEVEEDYESSGSLAFRTIGEGAQSDVTNTVTELHLLGKSVLEVPLFGYLVQHFIISVIVFALLTVVSFVIRIIWGTDKPYSEKAKKDKGKKKKKKRSAPVGPMDF